jgi:hypothetical protein
VLLAMQEELNLGVVRVTLNIILFSVESEQMKLTRSRLLWKQWGHREHNWIKNNSPRKSELMKQRTFTTKMNNWWRFKHHKIAKHGQVHSLLTHSDAIIENPEN